MFLRLPLHSPYLSLLIQPPLADDLPGGRPSFGHWDTEVNTIDKVPGGWGSTQKDNKQVNKINETISGSDMC